MDTTLMPDSSGSNVISAQKNPFSLLVNGNLTISASGLIGMQLVDAIKPLIAEKLSLAHTLEVRLDPRYQMLRNDISPVAWYLIQLAKENKHRGLKVNLVEMPQVAFAALSSMQLDGFLVIKAADIPLAV